MRDCKAGAKGVSPISPMSWSGALLHVKTCQVFIYENGVGSMCRAKPLAMGFV